MSMNARAPQVTSPRTPKRLWTVAALALLPAVALAQPGPGDGDAPEGAYEGPPPPAATQPGPPAAPQQMQPPPPEAPQQMQPPPPAAPDQRWRLLAQIGLMQSWAIGDRSFGLRDTLGPNGIEFDDAFGFDLVVGATTPNELFEIGLRVAVGFGALNRQAWEDELGIALGASQHFLVGPTARATLPLSGRLRPYASIDWLYASLGTSTGESDGEVCDDFGCTDTSVDRFFVRYEGFAFAYAAGLRVAIGGEPRPWRLFLGAEARFVQGNWSRLESGIGASVQQRIPDASALSLDHAQFSFAIGAAI